MSANGAGEDAQQPLLDGDAAEPLTRVRSTLARRRWKKLLDTFVAKQPVKGARVAESLDYEPIQNNIYLERQKKRKGTRHYYGCEG